MGKNIELKDNSEYVNYTQHSYTEDKHIFNAQPPQRAKYQVYNIVQSSNYALKMLHGGIKISFYGPNIITML